MIIIVLLHARMCVKGQGLSLDKLTMPGCMRAVLPDLVLLCLALAWLVPLRLKNYTNSWCWSVGSACFQTGGPCRFLIGDTMNGHGVLLNSTTGSFVVYICSSFHFWGPVCMETWDIAKCWLKIGLESPPLFSHQMQSRELDSRVNFKSSNIIYG